jgi:membrane protease YdiL (CAAX protease family)
MLFAPLARWEPPHLPVIGHMRASIVLTMPETEPGLSVPGPGVSPIGPSGQVGAGVGAPVTPPADVRTVARPGWAPLSGSPWGGGADVPFIDVAGSAPVDRTRGWRWVLYALAGFVVGQICAVIFGTVAGVIAGKTGAQLSHIATEAVPPEWYVVSTLVGLWVGFIGAPWLASRTQGTRHFFTDLGVRFRWVDLLGLVIGAVGQVAVGVLYYPFRNDIHNFNAPSQRLTGSSHGGGFLVIALFTVVFVPIMEELFFRGLLFKGLVRICVPASGQPQRARVIGVVAAVIIDGLLFGLAHGEWVQLAGLALFGMVLATVSYRTGRLGMNMVAHGSFNLVAVLSILHSGGGVIH